MTSATLSHVENILPDDNPDVSEHLIKSCETSFAGGDNAEPNRCSRKRKSVDRCGPSQSGGRKKTNRFGKPGEKIVLPKKFLLGGNITDPLNLNSLYYDQTGKVLNEKTPQSSPLPLPEYKKQVEVLIPPNINDPLNLNESTDSKADLGALRSGNHAKKKKNKHKKKRISLATSESEKNDEGPDVSEAVEEDDVEKPTEKSEVPEMEKVSSNIAAVIETVTACPLVKTDTVERQKSEEKLFSLPSIKPEKTESAIDTDDARSSASGQSKCSRSKTLHVNEKFIYGNYNRYYGYRNPGTEKDSRLDVLQIDWFQGKDVLDIGCNIGHITLSLARDYQPKQIVGMDIDGKLISIAKKNIRHYMTRDDIDLNKFPTALRLTYGPIAAPSVRRGLSAFPHNVMFVQGNYVLDKDEELDLVQEEYDTILGLSITKWIHLNFGDAGLKRVFKRMHKQLRPGGKLILEPQPWVSYKRKKKLTDTIFKNFHQIRLRPEQFTEYLLSKEVGFVACEHLAMPFDKSPGFRRPLQVYTKSESHLTPPEGVTPLMDIHCTPSDTPQICSNTPCTPYECNTPCTPYDTSSQDAPPIFELGGAGINTCSNNSPNTWNTPTYM